MTRLQCWFANEKVFDVQSQKSDRQLASYISSRNGDFTSINRTDFATMEDLVVGTSSGDVARSYFAGLVPVWQKDPRALWSSFSMIIVSEIGDKTFLIAAILAMRQSRPVIFGGAFGALALMLKTVIIVVRERASSGCCEWLRTG